MIDIQSRIEVLRPRAGDTIAVHIDVNFLNADARERIRSACLARMPAGVEVIVLERGISLTHIVAAGNAAVEPESKSAAEPLCFDAWMRERTEHAHREFMERTARRLPCDATTDDIARYMGDRG